MEPAHFETAITDWSWFPQKEGVAQVIHFDKGCESEGTDSDNGTDQASDTETAMRLYRDENQKDLACKGVSHQSDHLLFLNETKLFKIP